MRQSTPQNPGRSLSQTITIAIVMCVAIVANAQEKTPLAGHWKANLEKSQRHENHQFKSASLVFEMADNEVSITFSGINMAGKQEGGTRKVHPDGKEYPIQEVSGFVEIAKWITPNKLEIVAQKDGVVSGRSTYEVSSDKKALTATLNGIDGKGRPFEQIIIFDRE